MTVRTIICDLDGVLIWHHPHDPSKDWRRKILSREALILWEKFQCSPNWQKCLRDDALNTRFYFLDYLARHKYALNAEAQAVIDIWLEHNSEVCTPALRRLEEWQQSGFECAIATNQDGSRKPYIERWLQENGLGEVPRFISCDVKLAKPDNEYFLYVQDTLRRKPEELLLLDDQEKNIAGAHEVGWNAILIDETYRLDPSKWNSLAL